MTRIKLTDLISEASKIDLRYAVSRAQNFNGGLLSWDEAIELIVKDLGYRPTRDNLKIASDHIMASSQRTNIMTDDKDVFSELHGLLS